MDDKRIMTKGNLTAQDVFDKSFYDLKIVCNADVRNMVNMGKAVELMEDAFSSFALGKSYVPQRSITNFKEICTDIFYKPVFCKELGKICVKLLIQRNANIHRGEPAILGIVILFDADTREILILIDGTYFTALRTGAASGIATKYLAREDAETVAIIGCGAQGRTQLEAMCAVRPVKKAILFDIDPLASEQLKLELNPKLGIKIEIKTDKRFLREADIICTATNSELPLFGKDVIRAGVHINAIGSYKPHMQEIDPAILKDSKVFVDSSDAVLSESGDLIKPINEKVIPRNIIHAEIGNLINGKVTGRQNAEEITVFKSVGIAVQDLYLANEVYKMSLTR